MDHWEIFQRLGLAFAIGALIGLERGWHEREASEGLRVAGVRTLAIGSLLGALSALLADDAGELVLAVAFAVYAAAIIVFRLRLSGESHDYGVTTVTTAILTFVLGALVMEGHMAEAAAAAVAVVLILGLKPVVHEWLRRISYDELIATFKLLAISVIVLPLLPNQAFGPWDAFNPYEMWLMVVLISFISYVGYLVLRLTGDQRGIVLGGLAGGLLSSTAVAVSFARRSRADKGATLVYGAGIVGAASIMFLRLLVVVGVAAPKLVPVLALPLALAAVAGMLGAAVLWRHSAVNAAAAELILPNPLELGWAIRFGALLAAIMVLARAADAVLGVSGLYAFAAISGLADVDAIALTLARMTATGLDVTVAAGAVLAAGLVNTAVKIAICFVAGGPRLGGVIVLALGPAVAAAGASALIVLF